MDSVEFLDAVRARHGLTSDRKLAQFLGINQGRVSLYRTGQRKLDPEACIKVARALELSPEYVLASVQAERAKRTEHRRIWQRLAELAKRTSVTALGFLVIGVSGSGVAAGVGNFQLCIFCQIRQARRSRPVGPLGCPAWT